MQRIFSSLKFPDWPLGPTQSRNLRVSGAFSPRKKRSGRDANQSPLSSAEVTMIVTIPPLPILWRAHGQRYLYVVGNVFGSQSSLSTASTACNV